MSVTLTPGNPIIVTGTGTSGLARTTLYPGQMHRSFKVLKIEWFNPTTADTFTINDVGGSNVLMTGKAEATGQSQVFDFGTGRTWADWQITTSFTTGELLIWLS